jgi:hypothetical protein
MSPLESPHHCAPTLGPGPRSGDMHLAAVRLPLAGVSGCRNDGDHARKTIVRREPHVKICSVADCLFCQIASGLIAATTVMDSNRTLAFRDINPQAPTHVLVITKEHHADLAAVARAGDAAVSRPRSSSPCPAASRCRAAASAAPAQHLRW